KPSLARADRRLRSRRTILRPTRRNGDRHATRDGLKKRGQFDRFRLPNKAIRVESEWRLSPRNRTPRRALSHRLSFPLQGPRSPAQPTMFSIQKFFSHDAKFFDLLEASAEESRASARLLIELLKDRTHSHPLDEFALSRVKDKRITE